MSRNKPILIPGVYGSIKLMFVSRATIRKHAKERNRDLVVNGLYDNAEQVIYVAKELHGAAKLSVLLHELVHHTEDSTESLDEEAKCDVLGIYYHRLYSDPDFKKLVYEDILEG